MTKKEKALENEMLYNEFIISMIWKLETDARIRERPPYSMTKKEIDKLFIKESQVILKRIKKLRIKGRLEGIGTRKILAFEKAFEEKRGRECMTIFTDAFYKSCRKKGAIVFLFKKEGIV